MLKFNSLLFCVVLCAIVKTSLSSPIVDNVEDIDDYSGAADEYEDGDYYFDYPFGESDEDDNIALENRPLYFKKRAVWGKHPISNQGAAPHNVKRFVYRGKVPISALHQHNVQKRGFKVKHY